MCFMQTESVLQTKNRSGPAKNRFSVALGMTVTCLGKGFVSDRKLASGMTVTCLGKGFVNSREPASGMTETRQGVC